MTPEEELDKLGRKSFTPSTERKIEWAVDLYKQWWWSRMTHSVLDINVMQGDICGLNLNKASLAYSLCAFLNEIRRKDGQEFAGKGLYNIVILLQFHLEKRGFMWHLVEDPEFKRVRFTVDNLMKERCADQSSVSCSSSAISMSDEDKMWRAGVLGDDSPEKLRNTVMYLLGVCYTLRGGRSIVTCVLLVLTHRSRFALKVVWNICCTPRMHVRRRIREGCLDANLFPRVSKFLKVLMRIVIWCGCTRNMLVCCQNRAK